MSNETKILLAMIMREFDSKSAEVFRAAQGFSDGPGCTQDDRDALMRQKGIALALLSASAIIDCIIEGGVYKLMKKGDEYAIGFSKSKTNDPLMIWGKMEFIPDFYFPAPCENMVKKSGQCLN
jgi:hypothetical protein